MTSILVYGSLMCTREISALGVDMSSEVCPVKVRGFRREFSQEPSWRKEEGIERAVLNVSESTSGEFNGVLLRNISQKMLEQLDHRERGYSRITVETEAIRIWGDASRVIGDKVYTYTGKPEKWNEGLLPNRGYLDACLLAAKAWGDAFYEQFCKTTFVQSQSLWDWEELGGGMNH